MKLQLTRIRAENFKGLTFDESLAPATVFVGANFAGKSARGDAIRLALLGYLPELAQTARAAFEMSSAREMVVEATLMNEAGQVFRLWRRFFVKGDSIKTEASIPEEIAKSGVLAVMMNAEEYFGLGEIDRIRYVFQHVGGITGFSPDAIVARVDQGLTKDFPADPVADFCELMTAEGADWGAESKGRAMDTPQIFIERAALIAESIKRTAAATTDRMAKTIQGLSHLRAADDQGPTLAALEKRNGELTRAIYELTEQKQQLLGRYEEVRRARGRRRDLQAELAKAAPARATLADLQQSLGEVDAALSGLPADPESAVWDLGESVLAKQKELTKVETRIGDLFSQDAGLERARSEMQALTCCPFCGAEGDGWRKIKDAEIARNSAENAESRQKLATEQTRLSGEVRGLVASQAAARERSQRRSGLARQRDGILRQTGSLQQSLTRLDGLAAEIALLAPDDPGLEARVDTLQTDINVKTAEMRETTIEHRTALGRQGELRRLAEAEEARDKAQAVATVAAGAVKLIREIQSEMVEAAFGPLLAAANLFEHVMRTPLAYRNGEIGTFRNGVWISHRVFSGVEKALTYAAIQCALAGQAPIRLMILDELGKFDAQILPAVFRAIVEQIRAGRLDGFIGMAPAGIVPDAMAIHFVKVTHPDSPE